MPGGDYLGRPVGENDDPAPGADDQRGTALGVGAVPFHRNCSAVSESVVSGAPYVAHAASLSCFPLQAEVRPDPPKECVMVGFRMAVRGTSLACVVALIGSGGAARAQHGHQHSGHYPQQSGHFDYHPTTVVPHGNHFHVQPGHYDYHQGSHYVTPRQAWYPSRPRYVAPARTVYGYGEGHSHDHAGTHAPRQIEYGGFSHIDDLAIQLENEANALCLEMHYNYQHNPGYRQTYREAYEILTTAQYIHGLEHAGNRDKLRQAVGELDGLFHHVQADVASWTGHRHRRVGHDGLTGKLENLEQTLHHLMDDMGVRPAAATAAGDSVAPMPVGETAAEALIPNSNVPAPGLE
jgi:hypothetical protein